MRYCYDTQCEKYFILTDEEYETQYRRTGLRAVLTITKEEYETKTIKFKENMETNKND